MVARMHLFAVKVQAVLQAKQNDFRIGNLCVFTTEAAWRSNSNNPSFVMWNQLILRFATHADRLWCEAHFFTTDLLQHKKSKLLLTKRAGPKTEPNKDLVCLVKGPIQGKKREPPVMKTGQE